ncbi:hypothetical protein Patl1_21952 [Pistacia atlantica]|uniref:Uncharacterized protein n=1 Tax=Pistacia atlantica TaxID=434234 RepID=A0ACC1BNL6_9ROSI|nr:hypothetical protein Patl1_21952 [Pistacia atlantica]
MTEDLSLEEMNGVRNVLYELDMDGFPHLKHLLVKDCLELLFIIKSVAWNLAFPKLESLILHNLINLEKICHGQLNAGSFSKLRIMKIEKCDRLEYLFASSAAKNLTQLQEIEVTDCKNLKEIFGEENKDHGDEIETNDKIDFNQLCSLTLQRLPQFIKIGSDMRVVFPRLENLKLGSINIENTWLDQPLAMSSYSQCLKSLTVEECNGLKFLFSSSMVKSLNQLHKLVIGNCKSMEVIIDSKREEGEERIIDMSFPKLFYLKLEVLPKLVTFGIGNSIKFPSLNELHIDGCSNLKTFFCKSFYPGTVREEPEEELNLENYFIDINPLFDEKVAFPNLEVMVLLHLDNLQLIWHNQQLHAESFRELKVVRVKFCEKLKTIVPSNSHGLLTFHNLKELIVENCWSMKSLFPVTIATGLVQLNDLRLVSCGLEKIVSEEEVKRAPNFLFPQLTVFHLGNLPKLKCFYSGLHTTEWPMLNSLRVYGCKKIKIYASKFPSFQRKDDGESQPAIFLLEKVVLPSLETSSCFQNLTNLVIDGFDQLKYLFPSSTVKSLFKLKKLEISNCKFMERVIDEDEERSSRMFFPKLYELKLTELPKLTTFCNSTANIVEISSLFRLWIKNCPAIQTFISNSICGGMTSSSKENEEMSAKENYTRMQSLFDKKVRFPSLERLVISHADELVKIWDDQVSLDSFCKIKNVLVYFCKRLVSVFPSNMLGRHQKLVCLMVENCGSVEEIFQVLEKRSGKVEEIVDKEEAVPKFVFSNLACLSLQMLPSLKSLYRKMHISEWPNLIKLYVHGCDNVEIFASEFSGIQGTHGESQQPLFLVYKV